MKRNIVNFEHACRATYDSKKNDTNLGPHLWVKKAIEDKLFSGVDNGFTRTDNARDMVSSVSSDEIILSMIDVMIKTYDAETKYGNIHNSRDASAVVHLINTNNGMENLMEQLRYGMFLCSKRYRGDNSPLKNEERYYVNSFEGILDTFVKSNMSFNLLACNSKLVSFDSQKALAKFENYVNEKSVDMGYQR